MRKNLLFAPARTRKRRLDLINTPLQRGGVRVPELFNRFNGFLCVCRAVRNVLGRALSFGLPMTTGAALDLKPC